MLLAPLRTFLTISPQVKFSSFEARAIQQPHPLSLLMALIF